MPLARWLLITFTLLALAACAGGLRVQRFEDYGFALGLPSHWERVEPEAPKIDPRNGEGRRHRPILRALGEPPPGSPGRRAFVSCHAQSAVMGAQWVMERLMMISSIREREARFSEFEPFEARGLSGYRFSLYQPGEDGLQVDYVGFDHAGKVIVCVWGYRRPDAGPARRSRDSLRGLGWAGD